MAPPKTSIPPEMELMMGADVEKVMGRLRLMVLPVTLFAMARAPPVKTTELPVTTKGPAPAPKLMELKAISAVRLLTGANRVVPANTISSPAAGAVPPQFPPVLQLLSMPAPVQVRVTPEARPTASNIQVNIGNIQAGKLDRPPDKPDRPETRGALRFSDSVGEAGLFRSIIYFLKSMSSGLLERIGRNRNLRSPKAGSFPHLSGHVTARTGKI